MEMASSYCFVSTETHAEPSSSATMGSLSFSRNLAQSGASSSVLSSLAPWKARRCGRSAAVCPVRGSLCSTRNTSSTAWLHAAALLSVRYGMAPGGGGALGACARARARKG